MFEGLATYGGNSKGPLAWQKDWTQIITDLDSNTTNHCGSQAYLGMSLHLVKWEGCQPRKLRRRWYSYPQLHAAPELPGWLTLQLFTPETSCPPLPLPLCHDLPGLPDDLTLHIETEYTKRPGKVLFVNLLFVFLSVSVLLLRKKLLRFPKLPCGDRWKIKNSPKEEDFFQPNFKVIKAKLPTGAIKCLTHFVFWQLVGRSGDPRSSNSDVSFHLGCFSDTWFQKRCKRLLSLE